LFDSMYPSFGLVLVPATFSLVLLFEKKTCSLVLVDRGAYTIGATRGKEETHISRCPLN